MKKYKHIKQEERDLISLWRSQGLSIRKIAEKLDRSPSSISDETKRNSFQSENEKFYVAIHAHTEAEKRKLLARKRYPLKNKWVYSYVHEKLREGWSPEQISGKLKKDYPSDKKKHVSYETIYLFIYAKENKDRKLWEYLPRKYIKRRKKYGRKSQRVRIPDRVSIHKRSEAVNTRTKFGHWEGDSIVGKQVKGKIIHTEVERKTRLLKANLANNKSAMETIKTQIKIFDLLPKKARKSTTLDNGLEFAKHSQLGKILKMKTYFCDPYSSWQRGTNEYHNGLIRRYLPKGTSFDKLTQEELDDIVRELNNRPRKCLDYKTPEESFLEELNT